MQNAHPKHGSPMDLGRLRARLASPLTEVKSTESGKVHEVNIEVTGKVVKMLCAPYKDPQDPLKFFEALDTDMIILNANLADGADHVSHVVLAKLIDNPETVLHGPGRGGDCLGRPANSFGVAWNRGERLLV